MKIKFPLAWIDLLFWIHIEPSEENLAISHIRNRTQEFLIDHLLPGVQGIIINLQIRRNPTITIPITYLHA